MTNDVTHVIRQLSQMFPHSDRSVLAALLPETEVVARYMAQIHDLTVAEAREGVDLVFGALLQPELPGIAAE